MNPEFKRNLLIEFSAQRLIAMPVIIALATAAMWAGAGPEMVGGVAGAGFWIIILLWGTRKVAGSFDSELVNNTWDGQRLSALSGLALFAGKFFGAPAFVLYGAALLLLVKIVAHLHLLYFPDESGDTASLLPFVSGGTSAILASALRDLLAAFLALAVSMFVAIALLRRRRPSKGISVTLCQVAGIVVALALLQFFRIASLGEMLDNLPSEINLSVLTDQTVRWYRGEFNLTAFMALSFTAFLAWVVLGIIRELRGVLQFRSRRWAWFAFMLYAGAYFAGFDVIADQASTSSGALFLYLLIMWSVFVPLTYLAVFFEAKTLGNFRALVGALKARRWGEVSERIPFWVQSLILLFVVLMLSVLLGDSTQMLSGNFWAGLQENDQFRLAPTTFMFSVSLFLFRDCLLVLALNIGRWPVRSDLAAMIYLIVLYAVVPMLLSALGMNETLIMSFFLPGVLSGLNAVGPVGLEIVGLLLLVLWRWRKVAKPSSPESA